MKKMVILNITHGDHPCCTKNGFLPIAAGACRNDILNDACGEDNISHKNRYYGDLTSIYWAWKNLKGVDIIGTSHYRRYIADIFYLSKQQYDVTWKSFTEYNYSVDVFKFILKKYDFIMIKPLSINQTVGEQYINCHPFPENLKVVEEVLLELSPTYLKYWKEYINSNQLQFGFLFVTKWQHFNDLCSWLFPILEEVEHRIDVSQYQGYQSRVIAYLYERLVPIFIYKNSLSIFHMPMFFISEEGILVKEHIFNYWYSLYKLKIRMPIVQLIKRFLSNI